MNNELITISSELAHSEAKIERATRNAFYEVGTELRYIRDNRLYKEHYDTFEQYCLERWEWTPQRVGQYIAAADYVKQIENKFSILPSKERHVAPLAKLQSPEHRVEVWQRVVESNERITAKIVEREVSRKLAELKKGWITVDEWLTLSIDEKRQAFSRNGSGTFNQTNENIEWAKWTWNPVTGCEHDCPYCYAKDIAARFYPQEFIPSFYPDRLKMPQNTKVPPVAARDIGYKNVFVCSMADLFGKWVPQEWIEAVVKAAAQSPQWNFLFLTKNPQRMVHIDWPANSWVGTTVDKQSRIKAAQAAFEQIKGPRHKFLSCEPLLESLTFDSMEMFDWVIIGGRSKSSNMPEGQPEWAWVESLDRQARKYGCKLYHKPNLTVRPREYPES